MRLVGWIRWLGPRGVIAGVLGVGAVVPAHLLNGELSGGDAGPVFVPAFAAGAMLAWPRLWPALVLGAGFAYGMSQDDLPRDRLWTIFALAAVCGGLEAWLRLLPRGWDRLRDKASDARRDPRRALRAVGRSVRDAVVGTVRGTRGAGPPIAGAREILREGQMLLVIVAAILYGASWLAAQWFFGSVGVTPDEVGLTTIDLLLASGITTVLVIAGILVLDTAWRRIRDRVLRVPLFAAAGAALGWWADGWFTALFYLAGGAALGWFTARSTMDTKPRSRSWLAVVTGLALLALGVVALGTADEMRLRLEYGEPSTPKLLNIQVAVLWAPTVRVWPAGDAALPDGLRAGECVYRLGNADGLTVLLREGRVFRVPTQNVVSASGCAS